MFLLIDEYPTNAASPRGLHGCFTCGSPKRPEDILVDLGVNTDEVIGLDEQIHGFKKPIMCGVCITEIATMLGFMEPARAERLTQSHMAQADTIERLQGQINDYEDMRKLAGRISG